MVLNSAAVAHRLAGTPSGAVILEVSLLRYPGETTSPSQQSDVRGFPLEQCIVQAVNVVFTEFEAKNTQPA